MSLQSFGSEPAGGDDDERGGDAAAQLQQLRQTIELLSIENELLSDYIAQAEQQGIVTQRTPSKALKSARRRRDGADAAGRAQEREQPQQPPALSEDDKADIVNQAVEALQDTIQQAREAGGKDVDDIRTLMSEVELRIKETKQHTYDFKRDVILGAEDARTGRTSADRVLRFLQDAAHAKAVLVERLALKNSTAKAAIAKLEAQLAHKEEMGEVLHLVDYEQLKIENQQHLERIDAKNRELLRLKLSTGAAVQALNDAKDSLARLASEGGQLRATLAAKQRELDGFDADYSRTQGEAAGAAGAFKKLAAQHKDAEQPAILDYIRIKAHVAELQAQRADLARKLEVAAARRGGGSRGAAAGGGGPR